MSDPKGPPSGSGGAAPILPPMPDGTFTDTSQSQPAAPRPPAPEDDPLLGAHIGRFRIDGRLGAGGMGIVYAAHDETLQRRVALKLMNAASMADDARKRRFLSEARAAAALTNPHIATIYDVGEIDGHVLIAMEHVEGRTLRDVAKEGPVPPAEVHRIATEIARALCLAHEKGIVHRDLKPANTMMTEDGAIKLLDFGIAKWMDPVEQQIAHSSTVDGAIRGTPGYLSPEQARGEPVDARSDIFSLGVVLYELLTGARPFAANTPMGEVIATASQDPVSVHERTPDAGGPMADLVHRCLQKNPEDRFADGAELASALAAIEDPAGRTTDTPHDVPGAAASAMPPVETAGTATAPRGRRLAFWAGVTAAAVVIAAVGAMLWLRTRGAEDLHPAKASDPGDEMNASATPPASEPTAVAHASVSAKASTTSDAPSLDAPGPRSLWDLAPAGTTIGVVARAGAAPKAQGALDELHRLLEARAPGVDWLAQLESEDDGRPDTPDDIDAWPASGLDPQKPMAGFYTMDRPLLQVLPVVDRAAYRRAQGGSVATTGGGEIDVFAGGVCRMAGQHYLCADRAGDVDEALAQVGKSAFAKRAKRVPQELRTDLCAIFDFGKLTPAIALSPLAAVGLSRSEIAAVSATLSPGHVRLRGWLEGSAPSLFGGLFTVIGTPEVAPDAEREAQSGLRLQINWAELPNLISDGSFEGISDNTLALLRHASGEVTVYDPPGRLVIAVGFEKTIAIKVRMKSLCKATSSSATYRDGICQGTLDKEWYQENRPFSDLLPSRRPRFTLELKKRSLVLTLYGWPSLAPEAAPPTLPPPPQGPWNLSLWSPSLGLETAPRGALRALQTHVAKARTAEEQEQVALVRWLLGHVDYARAGFAWRDNGIHLFADLATFGNDPDAVRQAHKKALTRLVDGDIRAYVRTLRPQAKAAPQTRVGKRAGALETRATVGGVVPLLLLELMLKDQEAE